MQRNKTMRNGYFIRGMQVCMVLLLICLMGVFSCGDAYAYTEKDKEDPLYWRYLDEDGNLLDDKKEETTGTESFSSEAMMKSVDVTDGDVYSPYVSGSNHFKTKNGVIAHGIDVSKWNKTVNFKKVKEAGVDYVWIRCGYRGYGSGGSLAKDEYFEQNLKNALDAGMKVGVYVFSQAITEKEGIAEADLALDMLGDDLYRMELPIVMDVEYIDKKTASNGGRLEAAKLTNKQQTDIIRAFAKRVQEKGGNAAVYASLFMVEKGSSQKFDIAALEKEGIGFWIARYSTKIGYDEADYIAWQYDSGAKIDGCTDGEANGADVNFIYEDSLYTMYYDESRFDFQPVSVPENVKATGGSGKITLSWSQQEDVNGYVIMKRKENNSDWTRLAYIQDPKTVSYVDKAVSADTIYEYKISSVLSKDGMKRSDYSKVVYSMIKPDAPYVAVAGQTSTTDSCKNAKINWDPVKNASYYLLYRKDGEGDYQRIYRGKDLIYTDTDVTYGTAYTYKVRAAFEMPDGSKLYSKYSKEIEYQILPATPVMKSLNVIDVNTISVTWTPVEDALGYRVYRKEAGGTYGNYIAQIAKPEDGSAPVYVDNTAVMGKVYYYRVRAYVKNEENVRVYSKYAKGIKGYTTPVSVSSLSLKSVRYDRLQLTWELVDGMDGYVIQRLNENGSRTDIAKVEGEEDTYLIKGLTCGTTYRYAVCGYVLTNTTYVYGELDEIGLAAKPVPATPTATVTSDAKGKVSISWNKIAGATGYSIYYKAVKDDERTVIKRTLQEDARKLETTGNSGTTCYYAVRSYRTVNGKKIWGKLKWVAVKVK